MRIPDHMYYRPPEWWRERYQRYGPHFGRWRTDPRFLFWQEQARLPRKELRAIDRALKQRCASMQEQPISTRALLLGTATLALVVVAIVLYFCYFCTALN